MPSAVAVAVFACAENAENQQFRVDGVETRSQQLHRLAIDVTMVRGHHSYRHLHPIASYLFSFQRRTFKTPLFLLSLFLKLFEFLFFFLLLLFFVFDFVIDNYLHRENAHWIFFFFNFSLFLHLLGCKIVTIYTINSWWARWTVKKERERKSLIKVTAFACRFCLEFCTSKPFRSRHYIDGMKLMNIYRRVWANRNRSKLNCVRNDLILFLNELKRAFSVWILNHFVS